MDTLITNCTALLDSGWQKLDNLGIENGKISAINSTGLTARKQVDAAGAYVLPGIIDIHGDAFERHITPRAGTDFPLSLALAANDAGLVANGITSFFYSITDGFEPGPRSRDTVRKLLAQIEALRPRLKCNSFIHIRHETVNTDNHAELMDWLDTQRIDLLSLNDHLPDLANPKKVARYMAGLKRRVSMSEEQSMAFLHSLQDRRPLGEQQLEELVEQAHQSGVTLASHDDASQEDAENAIRRQVKIAEFPMYAEVASRLREQGCAVVMGAPNLVRGGSHVGGMSVENAIKQDLIDILCSDYHYPALYHAPFLLAEKGLLPFEEAWQLVSTRPAAAVGLADNKGRIAEGYDADLLVVRALDGSPLAIESVITEGKWVLQRETHAGSGTVA